MFEVSPAEPPLKRRKVINGTNNENSKTHPPHPLLTHTSKHGVNQELREETRDLMSTLKRVAVSEEEAVAFEEDRDNKLGELMRLAKSLEDENRRIIEKECKQHVKGVVDRGPKGVKHIALFHRLLSKLEPDLAKVVRKGFTEGFRAVGLTELSGIRFWKTETRESRTEVKDTSNFVGGLKGDLKERLQPPSFNTDEELTDVVKRIEKQVIDRLVVEILGEDITHEPSYTFGLTQADKVRLIVNQFINNLLSWQEERMKLEGIPYVLAMLEFLQASLEEEEFNQVMITIQDRKSLELQLQEAVKWRKEEKESRKGSFGNDCLETMAEAVKLWRAACVDRSLKKGESVLAAAMMAAGKPDVEWMSIPAVALQDFKSYFYQLPVEEPKHNVIGVWYPDLEKNVKEGFRYDKDGMPVTKTFTKNEEGVRPGKYKFFKSFVCNMGNVHSVYAAQMVSVGLSIIALRVLRLNCIIYIDDTVLVEINRTIRKAMEIYSIFLSLMGFEAKKEKELSSFFGRTIRVLGIGMRCDAVNSALRVGHLKEKIDRFEAAVQDWSRIANKRTLMPRKADRFKKLQKLVGVAVYMSCLGRVMPGKEKLRFLMRQVETETFFNLHEYMNNHEIQMALRIVLNAVKRIPDRVYGRGGANARELNWIYYDASTGGESNFPTIGAMLFKSDGRVLAFSLELRDFDTESIKKKGSTEEIIEMLEAMACVVTIRTFIPFIRGSVTLSYGDNQNIVRSSVRGWTGNKIVSSICTELAAMAVTNDVWLRNEYVLTDFNFGDHMTRGEGFVFRGLPGKMTEWARREVNPTLVSPDVGPVGRGAAHKFTKWFDESVRRMAEMKEFVKMEQSLKLRDESV